MNVSEMAVTIPYSDALTARDAYREAIRQERATEADRQLYDAYRAVAQGKRVIDISAVLQKAGVDAQFRPKLAICRADVPWGYFYFNSRRRPPAFWFAVREASGGWRGPGVRPHATISVPAEVFLNYQTRQFSGRARVPFIPPQYRPKHHLSNYHILWEAEWERTPPVDPLLVKHLRGPFFVILAAWNLTPLEQAVMRDL